MGKGVELTLRRSGGPLPVRVDRQQLENAILNLTINARDAMPDGGPLTIEAGREHIGEDAVSRIGLPPGSYVVVRVSDTGVGMSPEAVRRAVEPFYSTKAMGKGSGLGLSTALDFAHQSGGDLMIASIPGRGTTVSLYLPEAVSEQAGERAPKPDAAPADTPGTTLTVLVVDDEQRARRVARRSLSELGCEVLEADGADAAARVLEKDTRVDLLFTDVVMPGEMNGRELGRWAQRQRPGLKVLLTSGVPQREPDGRAAEGDAPPLLRKPYRKEELQEAVRSLLDTRTS
jgi:CheY-like chemotaxis protein